MLYHFENTVIESLLKPDKSATTTPAQLGINGVSGASSTTTKGWKIDLDSRLTEHGVNRWHDTNLKGEGVKVGIIDWGFKNLNSVPGFESLVTSSGDDEPQNTYLYLIEGVFTGEDDWHKKNDDANDDTKNSRIKETLGPGAYTIAATTLWSKKTGSYNLKLKLGSTAKPKPTTTRTATPTPTSVPTHTDSDTYACSDSVQAGH